MADNFTFSSNTETYGYTDVPSEWLNCERKSTIIAEKFLAFKTPLDARFNPYIPPGDRWTCKMLIQYMENNPKKLGLVIDLTDTDRYYLSNIEFISKNIRYAKIRCQGDNEIPNDKQIDHFIQICHAFINTNPNDIIGVHCTYGFNQTGFLICTYLCQKLDYNIYNAINVFEKARSPGIKKRDYLDKLVQKFGHQNLTSTEIQEGSKPLFAVNLVNVIPICFQPLLDDIRLKYQQMCGWNRQTFPGSKPVTMNNTNYETILKSPYMVSWKANGTRYMMLIENENRIYMLDRNNNVFLINNLQFPKYSDFSKHLTDTLIDGVFVIDNANGKEIYRYLVYDIVKYENKNVGQEIFKERCDIICRDIVDVRNKAIAHGRIDKTSEPFSIRAKDFWELSEVPYLLSPEFQSGITHGSDGLIFQPKLDPYQCGRSPNVLKWNTNNTIDNQAIADGIISALNSSISKESLCSLIEESIAFMNYQ